MCLEKESYLLTIQISGPRSALANAEIQVFIFPNNVRHAVKTVFYLISRGQYTTT